MVIFVEVSKDNKSQIYCFILCMLNWLNFNSTSLLPILNFDILNSSDEIKPLCTNIRQTIYVINTYQLLRLKFQFFTYEMMPGI
jgi:hypothetical protein